MDTKVCSRCGVEKLLSEYWKQPGRPGGMRAACKECHAARVKELKMLSPFLTWANYTLAGHRKQGYNVEIKNIELEAIARETTHCPVCGVELDYSVGKGIGQDNSPSMDRIDNESNISSDNVMIMCMLCNRTKSNRTLESFVKFCYEVTKRYPKYCE